MAEFAHGTQGSADLSGGRIMDAQGKTVWKAGGKGGAGGHQLEHNDLFVALRRGEKPNECVAGAHSTLTAIMGRMATYSGKLLKWDEALQSPLALADFDRLHSFDDEPPVLRDPAGGYQFPMPGRTTAF